MVLPLFWLSESVETVNQVTQVPMCRVPTKQLKLNSWEDNKRENAPASLTRDVTFFASRPLFASFHILLLPFLVKGVQIKSKYLFSDTSLESPFASVSSSSSSTLVVCRSWLRVGTPLLYSFAIIRSKAQANALQATLRTAPELGRFIKNLRVEGGFGKSMQMILKNTPNIDHLVLCLNLRAGDSSDGLAQGLPLIDPTRLTIIDEIEFFLNNKSVVKLSKAIESCAEQWENLNEVNFPYTQSMSDRESLCAALCSAPTVRIVSFPDCNSSFLGSYSLIPYLIKFAQSSSLQAIEIRPESQLRPPRAESRKALRQRLAGLPLSPQPKVTDPRLKKLICWIAPTTSAETDTSQTTPFIPKDSSFRPLASTPQLTADRIWTRILFFAMLSIEQHPHDSSPSALIEQEIDSARLQFLLVSRSFKRLACSYLYRYPVISSERRLASFSSAVVANPSLGPYIKELDLRLRSRHLLIPEDRAAPSVAASLRPLLPYTCNLTRLVGSAAAPHRMPRPESTTISWDDFVGLGKTAGGTLQEFTNFAFTLPNDDTTFSPSVFNHFAVLQKFTWKSRSPLDKITFRAVDNISAAALPMLEFLDIRTPQALSVFAKMKLPSLKRLALENDNGAARNNDWDTALLQAHGVKIQDLVVSNTDKKSVFLLCPSMTTLSWKPRCRNWEPYNLGCGALDEGFTHPLNKIILTKEHLDGKKGDEDWEKLFSALDVPHLSALREVSMPWCVWPKNEHQIAKSIWVKWADIFLKRGIKMTGSEGTEWRPRLKTSRRR
ncbi:hypothetical protein C8R47DRAFT_1189912 [Mycena vitilis]|nr:hypothetical protein C8R47DRAFT_1189912 [Mycena vitilis]